MTFEEMFAQAKTMLENASAKNADTAVAVQFDVSGEGCGAFYAVVSADSDKLTIEPYDYKVTMYWYPLTPQSCWTHCAAQRQTL